MKEKEIINDVCLNCKSTVNISLSSIGSAVECTCGTVYFIRGELYYDSKEAESEIDYLKELKRKAEKLNSNLIIRWSHLAEKWVSFIENSCYLEKDLVYIVSGTGITPDEALRNYYEKIVAKKIYLIEEGGS